MATNVVRRMSREFDGAGDFIKLFVRGLHDPVKNPAKE
jgi:hypothetical protein